MPQLCPGHARRSYAQIQAGVRDDTPARQRPVPGLLPGPDQAFHRAPSTFDTKMDAEAWLAKERKLLQDDNWTPARSRRAKVRRSTEYFGSYAEAWLA